MNREGEKEEEYFSRSRLFLFSSSWQCPMVEREREREREGDRLPSFFQHSPSTCQKK